MWKAWHFKRECPEWEREHRETIPLVTFDEERGSGALLH
jgi:hypothetical protein